MRTTAFSCCRVACGLVLKSTLTISSCLTWFDQETTYVPNATKRPSRNMPTRTVIVAATVVEMFAPRLRHASETSSRSLTPVTAPRVRGTSFACVAPPALVAREPSFLELDHTLAHLVD